MRSTTALKAYSTQSISSKTEEKSAEELITLLFDKCCVHIASMKRVLQSGDITEYVETTSKAVQIILSLRAVLDMEKGGEVARKLSESYTLIAGCLWHQISAKDQKEIQKLHDAVAEIRAGWVASI